jgi:hypothetical protein
LTTLFGRRWTIDHVREGRRWAIDHVADGNGRAADGNWLSDIGWPNWFFRRISGAV